MSALETHIEIPDHVGIHEEYTAEPLPYFYKGCLVADEKYRVLSIASSNPTADVYKAVDDTNGSPVAVKVHRETSVFQQQRVDKELTAFIGLQGLPGIAPVYDLGILCESDYPKRYTATHLGETLDARIRDDKMDVDDLLTMSTQVLHGIESVHGNGLVHRDIKPGNIIFRNGDWELIDFGSVEALGEKFQESILSLGSLAVDDIITDPNLYISPGWVAPEVVRRNDDRYNYNPEADVFSFGVTLYNAETGGKFPYDIRKKNLDEIVTTVITESPASARELNRAIPAELEKLTLECLSHNPEDRPTIDELERRLESI
jgi:serine/threonine protein kinase